MANISFRKLDSQGNVSKVFNLRQEDVSPERLSMLFRLEKESIYLTTETNEVFFQQDFIIFAYLYQEEYFVNGDPINTSTTQLSRMTTAIDRSLALDTRGMPASPINRILQEYLARLGKW